MVQSPEASDILQALVDATPEVASVKGYKGLKPLHQLLRPVCCELENKDK